MLKKICIILPFKKLCGSSTKPKAMNNVPREINHCVNSIDMHKNDSVINWTTIIVSGDNTLKNINLGNNFLSEIESTFFHNKDVHFSFFFRKYIEKTVEDI